MAIWEVKFPRRGTKLDRFFTNISWEPFRICLLNSTANSAQFWWKWAGLAVLFSRQILNGSQVEIVMNELRKLKMSADFFANTSHDIYRCPGV